MIAPSPTLFRAPWSFFFLTALLVTLSAQVEPPHEKTSSEGAPRDLLVASITRTLKAWESPDPAPFLAAFAEDALFAYPGARVDKPGLAALFADLHARKRDVRIYVGPFIVVGNEFIVRYQFACTDRVTGKRQAVGTGVRGSLRDGLIVKFKEYWDAHVAVDQANGDVPLDEGIPDFPAPASVVMTPKRIN